MLYQALYHSPIGSQLLVASDTELHGIWFLGQKYFANGLDEPRESSTNAIISYTMDWLDAYFKGDRSYIESVNLVLALKGTDFQKLVWTTLQSIPYGQSISYGQLAQLLEVNSAQAIGGAVGRNPFSILIPCHRVLGAQGQLTGYAGGIEKKIWLLNHEGIAFKE